MDISTTYQNPTARLNLKGNLFVLYWRFWSTYVWSEIDPPVYRQLCPCSYIIQCLIWSPPSLAFLLWILLMIPLCWSTISRAFGYVWRFGRLLPVRHNTVSRIRYISPRKPKSLFMMFNCMTHALKICTGLCTRHLQH